jgi:hypothetical protein
LIGDRCILSVKYVPAGSARRLGGFLRYVQFRDQHQDAARDRALSGLTKYIAHRDRTAPGGRLFGPLGNCGDLDRRAVLAHIARSLRDGPKGRQPRAAYRMVLSPERAEGLDLKELTRAAMDQLGRDVGGTPPWIAAIHRNTAHPHVHIVMAARREVSPGQFRDIVVSKPRLSRMKLAIDQELSRERGELPKRLELSTLLTLQRGETSGNRRRRRIELDRTPGTSRMTEPWLRRLGRVLRQHARQQQIEMEREMREQQRQHEWEP